jgi:hypothetical protein
MVPSTLVVWMGLLKASPTRRLKEIRSLIRDVFAKMGDLDESRCCSQRPRSVRDTALQALADRNGM